MTESIAHLPFIVGSYAAAALVVGALLAWVTLDYRALRRALAELEKRGTARRSAARKVAAAQATRQDAMGRAT